MPLLISQTKAKKDKEIRKIAATNSLFFTFKKLLLQKYCQHDQKAAFPPLPKSRR